MRRNRLPKLIAMSIAVMQAVTGECRNFSDSPLAGLYVKTAERAHQDSPSGAWNDLPEAPGVSCLLIHGPDPLSVALVHGQPARG